MKKEKMHRKRKEPKVVVVLSTGCGRKK